MDINIDMRSITTMAAKYNGGPQIVEEETRRGMTRVVLQIEGDAKRVVPVDRGQLRRSLTHEVTASGRNIVGKVGSNLPYAAVIEEGRKPGSRPPSGPLEAWARRKGLPAGYGYVIASYIGYQGTKARPYLKPAFTQNEAAIRRELGTVLMRRITERLGAR